ncbi:helix-turn-helix domain-containing protein [Neisseria animaloris]|uniref:helix-turn-helix domain-containing protein n=1 Tax=Neisseria animaloris TaxID=326522 RepID=UPI0039E18D51
MKNETAQNAQSISDGINKASRNYTPFSPESQCGEILAILQSGQSLTSYQAAQMGIMGFNARVMDLRRAGYPVVCTMQPHINKRGRTVKRGIYTLAVEKGAA